MPTLVLSFLLIERLSRSIKETKFWDTPRKPASCPWLQPFAIRAFLIWVPVSVVACAVGSFIFFGDESTFDLTSFGWVLVANNSGIGAGGWIVILAASNCSK